MWLPSRHQVYKQRIVIRGNPSKMMNNPIREIFKPLYIDQASINPLPDILIPFSLVWPGERILQNFTSMKPICCITFWIKPAALDDESSWYMQTSLRHNIIAGRMLPEGDIQQYNIFVFDGFNLEQELLPVHKF